jgi:hypothetical protein
MLNEAVLYNQGNGLVIARGGFVAYGFYSVSIYDGHGGSHDGSSLHLQAYEITCCSHTHGHNAQIISLQKIHGKDNRFEQPI